MSPVCSPSEILQTILLKQNLKNTQNFKYNYRNNMSDTVIIFISIILEKYFVFIILLFEKQNKSGIYKCINY